MSLDVWLTLESIQNKEPRTIIPFWEGGRMVELTREEWDERFPGREPMTVTIPADCPIVWDWNITHNLGAMAEAAGLYRWLWRPDEAGVEQAGSLVRVLRKGLAVLEADPERFRAMNPENGWEDYEGLVEFVREYLTACQTWPNARVSVWR
jgi:hypothetical protein